MPERFRNLLYGPLRVFEGRVLLVVLLYAILGSSTICIISFFSEFYQVIYQSTLPLGLSLLVIFLILRFVPQAEMYVVQLGFAAITLCYAFLAFLWPVTQGSFGNTPFFFLLLIFYQILLFRGWFLAANIAMGLALLLALIFYEALHPGWIAPSPDSIPPMQHAMETAISLSIAILLSYIIGSSYKRGWGRIVKQRERHKKEFEEDLILSRNIQKQIYKYPKELVRDFDFYAHIQPSSEIGGDLFELSSPQEGCLRVFLADAQGHGINAALSSVLIKGEWAHLKNRKLSPSTLLNKLNKSIIEAYEDNISFTALVADIYSDRLVFSSAGHPVQYIAIAPERKVISLENSGPPAGMFDFKRYKQKEFFFPKGARAVFFTDALIEEGKDHHNPTGWLQESLRSSKENSKLFAKHILREFARQVGQPYEHLHLTDDLLLLVVGHL